MAIIPICIERNYLLIPFAENDFILTQVSPHMVVRFDDSEYCSDTDDWGTGIHALDIETQIRVGNPGSGYGLEDSGLYRALIEAGFDIQMGDPEIPPKSVAMGWGVGHTLGAVSTELEFEGDVQIKWGTQGQNEYDVSDSQFVLEFSQHLNETFEQVGCVVMLREIKQNGEYVAGGYRIIEGMKSGEYFDDQEEWEEYKIQVTTTESRGMERINRRALMMGH